MHAIPGEFGSFSGGPVILKGGGERLVRKVFIEEGQGVNPDGPVGKDDCADGGAGLQESAGANPQKVEFFPSGERDPSAEVNIVKGLQL